MSVCDTFHISSVLPFTAAAVLRTYRVRQANGLSALNARRIGPLLRIAMLSLDSMLRIAASADNWTRVVHRCAWCKRVSGQRGLHRHQSRLDTPTR